VLNNITVAGEVFDPKDQFALLERLDKSTLDNPVEFNRNEIQVVERILKKLR